MRDKYIEERFPRFFEFGCSEEGKVDVASTVNDTIATVSKEQAQYMIDDRDILLDMLITVVNALDEVDSNRLEDIWYNGGQ
jgi:hypothetical protein